MPFGTILFAALAALPGHSVLSQQAEHSQLPKQTGKRPVEVFILAGVVCMATFARRVGAEMWTRFCIENHATVSQLCKQGGMATGQRLAWRRKMVQGDRAMAPGGRRAATAPYSEVRT